MPTRKDLHEALWNLLSKGVIRSENGEPIGWKVSYHGVLNDIHQAILLAHELRTAEPRERLDRIVADLAHILTLIQASGAKERPNRHGEMAKYAGDLLDICHSALKVEKGRG